MKITPQDWSAISALVDEALDIPPHARGAWLDGLPDAARPHRARIEAMLAEMERPAADFLDTLPPLSSPPPADDPQDRPPDLPPEGRQIGPYRLLQPIGSGGMGSVWLAERVDGVLKRTVALKLPHRQIVGSAHVERLARERDILASLDHPNIARLYDAGVTGGGHPYLAMELVRGLSITEHCDRRRLGLVERIALFDQVLRAVQYAHTHLVIHRDIKPANILVTAEGRAMLLDFGIAKLTSDGQADATALTLAAGRALTPEYASPEQIAGRPLTTASDVYSLGRVLYELLTGQRPFRLLRESAAAIEEAILGGDPIPPSQADIGAGAAERRGSTRRRLAAALAGDLDTILSKALKRDPAERYPTAAALAEDLRRHLQGEPVLARPDALGYRARKFVRRHRLAIASAGTVFAALAGGLGTALWQASRAEAQSRIAESEAARARIEATRSALEARKAATIKGFLVDVFHASDPNAPGDKPPSQYTAKEILDAGARRIEHALADQPETKLDVLLTLGGLYGEIGVADSSARLCQQALRLAEVLSSRPTLEQADALRCLALAFEGRDNKASADHLARADRILAAIGDRESLVYAQVQTLKAGILRDYGSATPADLRDTLKAVMPVWKRYPTHQGHLYAWIFLAGVQWELGDRAGAVAAADEAIAVAADGAGGPVAMADARRDRASFALRLGDPVRAASELEGAVQVFRERLGARHWRTWWAECDLGRAQVMSGRRDAGLELLRRTVDAVGQAQPGSDAHTVCLERQASSLATVGRADLAEAAYAKADAYHRRAGSTKLSQPMQLGLAQAQDFRGHPDAARRMLQPLVDGTVPGALPPLRPALRLAEVELRDGRLAHAGELLTSALDPKRGPTLTPTDALAARTMSADLARRQGDPAGAIRLADAALAAARQDGVRWPMVEAQVIVIRAAAGCASGLPPAEAEAALAQAVDTLEASHDPASPHLAAARAERGLCLLRLGRRDEAAALANRAEAALRRHRELHPAFWRPVRALREQLATVRA